MTVTSTINYKQYQGDGIATSFTIPFLLLNRNDLQVYIDNQLLNTGYTLTGLGNPTSTIVFTQAPTGVVLLQRNIDLLRDTDYQENGDLLADTLNRDFDRIYLAMQGSAQNISQSLRVIDPEGINVLPLKGVRANKLLYFDNQGQPKLTNIDNDSALDLASALANSNDEQKGAGLVGFSDDLVYPPNTAGSAIQSQALSFANTNNDLSERLNTLETWKQESRFTIIYPNGGTADNPATVSINNRYVLDNPFKGKPVHVVVEVLAPNGVWGTTGWLYASGSYGVAASHNTEEDSIIIQTGYHYILSQGVTAGGSTGYSGANINTPLPCRVKVWRVD